MNKSNATKAPQNIVNKKQNNDTPSTTVTSSVNKKPVPSVKNSSKTTTTTNESIVKNNNKSKPLNTTKSNGNVVAKSQSTFKKPLSYEEMLKLANKNSSGKNINQARPTSTQSSVNTTSQSSIEIKSLKKPSLSAPTTNLNGHKSKSNQELNHQTLKSAKSQPKAPSTTSVSSSSAPFKRYLPGDIRYNSLTQVNNFQLASKTVSNKSLNDQKTSQIQQQKVISKPHQNGSVTSNQPKKTTITGTITSTTVSTSSDTSKISAWERATADVKRLKNANGGGISSNGSFNKQNLNKKRQTESDYGDYDDEEDEYDSDMDSFICDDDEDDDFNGSDKKNRNKNSLNNSHNKNNKQHYSSEIRKIFGYNPERYKYLDDDDDPNMEASYHEIEKEERKRYAYFNI